MVGVGSGSALNAFNIGQQATGQSAIGQQITAIVQQADKLGISQGAAGATAGAGIATAQYKNDLEANKTKDIVGYGAGDPYYIGRGVPESTQAVNIRPNALEIPEDTGLPPRTIYGDTDAGRAAQSAAQPKGGANPFAGIDPNAELSPEAEAAIRAALGL